MSDNWLQLVPADPQFLPSPEAAERARTLLASFAPDSESITAEFKEHVEFFHPGGNWSGVECPSCGANAEPWWEDAMRRSEQSHFEDLTVTTPCCKSRVSLNELRYLWPAAFGHFVLEAMNPNVKDITAEQELSLSRALGSLVHKVWVHI